MYLNIYFKQKILKDIKCFPVTVKRTIFGTERNAILKMLTLVSCVGIFWRKYFYLSLIVAWMEWLGDAFSQLINDRLCDFGMDP